MASSHATTGRFKDLTGYRCERLEVVEMARVNDFGVPEWKCRCQCGKEFVSVGVKIVRKRSCGCLAREQRMKNKGPSKHNMTNTPEFAAWNAMLQRCKNPNVKHYHLYGGRGIKVCDRWKGPDGFVNFFADLGHRPSPDHSLNRKDNDGNYSPENCNWATRTEQAKNRRLRGNILKYDFKGTKMRLAEIAALAGISYGTAHARLLAGWTPERIATTGLQGKR